MTISTFKKQLHSIESSLRHRKIFIFSGGFGEERSASLYTANAVYKELASHNLNIQKIDPSKKNITRLNYKNSIVFSCLHGSFGETGHVPAILDYLKVPYVFSSVSASVLTAQKLFFKSAVKKIGFETPVDNFDEDFFRKRGYFIHKKKDGGGSIGMYIDKRKVTESGYFTENFLRGRILTLGVLENSGIYTPLEIAEIKLKGKSFYDKDAKYNEGSSKLVPYDGQLATSIKKMSERIFDFIGIRKCGRIDLVESQGKVFMLEINSIPGLYAGSNLQYSAELAGLSFYELLVWILNHAKYDVL